MISLFCQYSYGGFKTFRINGETHEELTQEVTAENTYGFPKLADLYFNQGGAKVLYRYLDSDTISLIIREIPGPGLDTDNRQINCAVQFIGDASDRKQLDRLAIRLLNNLKKFEAEFADMFDMRGGLFFDGDRLLDIVKECEFECRYEGESSLLQILDREGIVLLFVPFSLNFAVNPRVTEKILSELQLPEEASRESRFMSLTELQRIQNFLEIKCNNKMTNKIKRETLEDVRKELEQIKQERSHLRQVAINVTKENDSLKAEYEEWKKKAKMTLLIGGGILGISLLANIVNFFFKE
jgi:hypothetical protein